MNKPGYSILKDGRFCVENFNQSPAFSSFFPGIAGIFGCPMWVFYANRGQCIASAGICDKDGAIIEFYPANKAYRLIAQNCYRTFIKCNNRFYEPFNEGSPYKNRMIVSPDSLAISEDNDDLKIKTEITYFNIPNESYPALARMVRITNLSRRPKKIDIIDGLPILIPFGFTDDLLKRICQTTSAWCKVDNLDKGAPFYRLKTAPKDICETQELTRGNFYLSFGSTGKTRYIVDPKTVFGETGNLTLPDSFLSHKKFKVPTHQATEGIMPSGLSFAVADLDGGGSFEIFSLIGQAASQKELSRIEKRAARKEYFLAKFDENRKLIDDIGSHMSTRSSSRPFDLYTKQTFLDNCMRGGLPVNFGGKTVYAYYRKHGDMERDYNNFKLMPTFFSQGDGNYRDISQNRRNDIFFNPDVAEHDVIRFLNLIQADGFNPLVVIGRRHYMKSPESAARITEKHIKNAPADLPDQMTGSFLLGELVNAIEESGAGYKTSRESFITDILESSEVEEKASHGDGFWTDHFAYNTDLLESYENIYPERIQGLLFDRKVFTFFDNDRVVQPREKKYRFLCGLARQYGSVKEDPEKQDLLRSRNDPHNHILRTEYGKGETFRTTLAVKLLCIAANKAASFDAEGIGIEMEADKPNWYDALNGLPSLFGSSLSETLELKRLCVYTLDHLPEKLEVRLPVELKEFMDGLNRELAGFISSSDSFNYWDRATALKETYRGKTKLGVSGEETQVDREYVELFLQNIIGKCDHGVKKCLKNYKNYYTYFINEAVEHEPLDGDHIKVKKFRQKPLPLFLEGFVHALKVEKDRSIYKTVKNSPLYDKKLKMYRVNASLKEAPLEIGRAKIFTPGWLENESIWLHMEYKYLLELLKAGMKDEFFSEFKNLLVPFMSPKKYKRSIFENSSFIASSAHPNRTIHGRGFYARLSGASAEFIDIWLRMTTGKNIFFLDQGKLCFKLNPILPAWLFDRGKFSFTLLGSIETTYLNPKKKNGVSPISYKLTFEGKEVDIDGPVITEPYATLIRERKVKKICCLLG
ncbi:MAG: cellobiose phosphorylase [Candidatus Margulisiibacteriota bacterium]